MFNIQSDLALGGIWILFFLFVLINIKNLKNLRSVREAFNTKHNWLTNILGSVYVIFFLLLLFQVISTFLRGDTDWTGYLTTLIVASLIVPIGEEVVFRGFLIGSVSEGLKLKGINMISLVFVVNLFFALLHIIATPFMMTKLEVIIVFAFGLIISAIYLKSKKNILYPILLHLLVNIAIMYFFLHFY